MVSPDYNGRSIVNLVSTIQTALGSNPLYPNLKDLDPEYLSSKKNILLIVLDGLGYQYLMEEGEGTIFNEYMKSRLTSVFPSTTASAITTFTSGVAPQEHAVTGWFMYFKEVGTASLALPFCPRFSGIPYSTNDIAVEDFYNFPSIFPAFNRDCHIVTLKHLKNSSFNKYSIKDVQSHGYTSLKGFTRSIATVIKKGKKNKYIYAYWPGFDKRAHQYGINSSETLKHLKLLDRSLRNLLKHLKGTDTVCLITADHGLIDTIPERNLTMAEFPDLKDMLILPLCGEPRVPYCYVKASRKDDFRDYVEKYLPHICKLYSREEIISQGFFGLKEENPKFRDRIGDFVLLMKENYVLHDWITGETPFQFIGYHGNLTPEEMYVPLVKIDL